MGRFKAVFLDVGGTLLRMSDPATAYCGILAEHGYAFEPERVGEALAAAREAARQVEAGPLPDLTILPEREHARRERMLRELLERLGVSERVDVCHEAIRASWLGTTVFEQFAETTHVVARLKREGYIVGIVSNWEPRLEALLTNHGLRDHFDFILASEAEGHVKPAPYLYEKGLRLASVPPQAAVHVGDSCREDVEAARAVGIEAVLLARDGDRAAGYSPTIRRLDELFSLLDADDWIRGQVVSGVGKAANFTEVPWVRDQVRSRLGFTPHAGTLNLRVSEQADRAAFDRLKAQPGVPLEPEPGYCAAHCYSVLLEGRQSAAVVVPEVPDYPPDSLELLAPVRLRDALTLDDGALLTVGVTDLARTGSD